MNKDTRSDRIYRRLLRLFPFDFQREYGADMHATFRDERRHADGVRLWSSTLAGFLRTAPAEHLDVFRRDVRDGLRSLAVRRRPSDRYEAHEPPIDFHDAGARRPRRSVVVMVRHILKKYWRLLWPLVTALAILQGLLASARFTGHFFGLPTVPMSLLELLAVAAVITLVVLQDPIPGVRQDWLVRPIARRDLFLAKLLFVVVLVQGPWFVTDLRQGRANGFSFGQSAAAAVLRSLRIDPLPRGRASVVRGACGRDRLSANGTLRQARCAPGCSPARLGSTNARERRRVEVADLAQRGFRLARIPHE